MLLEEGPSVVTFPDHCLLRQKYAITSLCADVLTTTRNSCGECVCPQCMRGDTVFDVTQWRWSGCVAGLPITNSPCDASLPAKNPLGIRYITQYPLSFPCFCTAEISSASDGDHFCEPPTFCLETDSRGQTGNHCLQ